MDYEEAQAKISSTLGGAIGATMGLTLLLAPLLLTSWFEAYRNRGKACSDESEDQQCSQYRILFGKKGSGMERSMLFVTTLILFLLSLGSVSVASLLLARVVPVISVWAPIPLGVLALLNVLKAVF